MKLSEIKEILEARILTGEDRLDMEIRACGSSDLMSDILAKTADDALLITGLTTVQAVRTALVAGISALVFVRDKTPESGVIEHAKTMGVPMLSSPFSMFVASGRLFSAGMPGLDGTR